MRFKLHKTLTVTFTALLISSSLALADSSQILRATGLDKLRGYISNVSGVLAKIDGDKVFIANDTGLTPSVGATIEVSRIKEVIKHPVTGELLGEITEKVAIVKVISANKKLIVASVLKKTKSPKAGDRIGSSTAQKPVAAFVQTSGENTLDKTGLQAELSSWSEIDWVEQYQVERFIFDEGITKDQKLLAPKTLKAAREWLKVDFVVLLSVVEKNDSMLTDAVLYKTKNEGKIEKTVKGMVSRLDVSSAGMAKSSTAPIAHRQAPPTKSKPTIAQEKIEGKESSSAPKLVASKSATRPHSMKVVGKAKTLGEFEEGVSGVATYDFDGDGNDEIVVTLKNSVHVYSVGPEGLVLRWEKSFSGRNEISGVYTGDFDGDGSGEIYINNSIASRIRSMVFEGDGSNFSLLADRVPTVFYVGDGMQLYGRGQKTDFNLGFDIYLINWKSGSMDRSVYATLPKRGRMTGLGFGDIDNDGEEDITCYSGYNLIVYFSSAKKWKKVSGSYGGSNNYLLISSDGMTEERHEFMPSIRYLKSSGTLLAIKNKSPFGMLDNPTYTDGQIVLLRSDGSTLYEDGRTPIKPGSIQGMALYNGDKVLVARTSLSFFGRRTGTLVLTDPRSYQ